MIKFVDSYSAGYRKDLALISLVYGLLYVSDDIEKKGIENYDGLEIEDYDYPEGFKEMLVAQINEIKGDIYNFMKSSIHRVQLKQIKAKSNALLHQSLNRLQNENVSLDVLSMYILFYNFIEREGVLHESYRQFADISKYQFVVDTYDSVGMSLFTKLRMSKLAKEIIMMKG